MSNPWNNPLAPAVAPPVVPAASSTSTAPGASLWQVHKTPDGKEYYYNTATRQTTWNKPEELKTYLDKALESLPWKEFLTPDGKKYFFNSQTNITTWEMPMEMKTLIDAHSGASSAIPDDRKQVVALPPKPIMQMTDEPTYVSRAEAETAFKDLLEETGVDYTWSWEDCMRAIVDKPDYRALKTTAERKQCFQIYVDEKRKNDRENRKVRFEKDKKALRQLFDKHPSIASYSRWRKVNQLLDKDLTFQKTNTDDREIIFEEWASDLRRKEKEDARALRKENMDKFRLLLQTLELDVNTTWAKAEEIYTSKQSFIEDKKLQEMDMIDFLTVFEDHMRVIEDKFFAQCAKDRDVKYRTERKNRDAFRDLLEKLKNQGKINARTKFKEIYPLLKNENSFQKMMGQSGSTPLECFWDMQMELDEQFSYYRKMINDAIQRANVVVTPDMSFPMFIAALPDEQLKGIDMNSLRIVFEELIERAALKQREEQRKREKKAKRLMDDFRYILKKLDPPINVGETWEDIRSRVQFYEEYEDLEEVYRIEAFAKFMKRLKEKMEYKKDEETEGEKEEDLEKKKRKSKKKKHRHRSSSRSDGKKNLESDRGKESSSDDESKQKRSRKRHRRHPDDADEQ